MSKKLQHLSRSDLIALIEEFAPREELALRVDELLELKTERAKEWQRENAGAFSEHQRWLEENGHPLAKFFKP
ncbi:type II toxin-antitoxin system CcdA family antitoxin [Ruegeria marisrubri]|uniref:type II toxin-antitoxin system CcdA family antitoxin n=1 Tax=Ruegeria marisrubri TaxID=1685379 RepID=UPI0009EA8351|nr:type II toxin-antitoxin system CcdA family antitoxin [Ruegeria marisrubri]